MSQLGGTTDNSSKKTSENLLTTGTLSPWLTSNWFSFTWLVALLAITTCSTIYFNSFLFEVVSFMNFWARLWVPYACLTNPISRVTSMPFDSKRIRLATKSTPPYFKIQPMAHCLQDVSLLGLLTSIQRQHRPSEYLQGYMVDLSSNIVLLISARVGFLRQFSASGYRWGGDLSLCSCSTSCQEGLGFFSMRAIEQNQRNPYECGSSYSRVVPCTNYIQLAEL
jgi:hypothetical protein